MSVWSKAEGKARGIPSVTRKLVDRADVGGLVGIGVKGEVFGDLPNEDLQSRACQRSYWRAAIKEHVPCHRRNLKR